MFVFLFIFCILAFISFVWVLEGSGRVFYSLRVSHDHLRWEGQSASIATAEFGLSLELHFGCRELTVCTFHTVVSVSHAWCVCVFVCDICVCQRAVGGRSKCLFLGFFLKCCLYNKILMLFSAQLPKEKRACLNV